MLMVIEHPVLRVRVAVDIVKLLSGAGFSPEEVESCRKKVPPHLRDDVGRCASAIDAFVKEWSAAVDTKPMLPVWAVYIHALA